MTTSTIARQGGNESVRRPAPRSRRRGLAWGVAAIGLVGAMTASTKVVRIGSPADQRAEAFSPDSYAGAEFPKIADWVRRHAAEPNVLLSGLREDREATVSAHGSAGSIGPELAVRFTGTFGEGQRGIYPVRVDGLPDSQQVRVQMGPAINGTDLRDVTGAVQFGQFRNQIDYQNVGAALNRAMKQAVLSPLGNGPFTGKTFTVVGAFRMINPASWLITPVEVKAP